MEKVIIGYQHNPGKNKDYTVGTTLNRAEEYSKAKTKKIIYINMKDKDKLAPLLRALKLGHVDFDYVMDFILHIYSDSKRFNWDSFSFGTSVGAIITYIMMKWVV